MTLEQSMKNVLIEKVALFLKGESTSQNPPIVDIVKQFTSVLVIGKAKTGTTFLAKAIQNSLDDCSLVMEPKDAAFIFDRYGVEPSGNEVAKLIFEHWTTKSNLMSALLADELPIKFSKKVIIVRDPRDELVSRLLYLVKPLRDQGKLNEENLPAWLQTLRDLETGDNTVSFLDLIKKADELFKTDFLASFLIYLDKFSSYYDSKPNSVFAIRYEDLIDHRIDHLETYLGFKVNFDIAEDEYIKRTKRSSSYDSWKAFFRAEDVEYFQPILQGFMEKIGYKDWAITRDERPLEEVTSQYVERLASD
jgi:hypothetical protein